MNLHISFTKGGIKMGNTNILSEQTKPNRNWINYINLDDINLFPIQFANCDRLFYNDVVYIFDEVGSGKTLSSGLMAMDYLYNNPNKKVLVITTNTLAKTNTLNTHGQFLKDWYDKLPFEKLELNSRIDIVNNHYSSFQHKKEYGLVIIDEAHLFLNEETQRYENLVKNIRSKKLVFLTATPIKSNENDLKTYTNIAEKILSNSSKPIDRSWINKIKTEQKDPRQIICSTFDEKFPVTRYFKNTITSLTTDGCVTKQPHRVFPEIWKYDSVADKNHTLRDNINLALKKNPESHFIIFTRLVYDEAYKIAEDWCNNSLSPESTFTLYGQKPLLKENSKTIKVITGENAYELEKFKGYKNLPTVLILTYQIAEQGVNLPGFNYVINYHISAFPSALEQRFGRIDRIGKRTDICNDIHMVFLISRKDWDTNTMNFFTAISIYMHSLINYLPSKNTILSPQILQEFKDKRPLILNYFKDIQVVLKKPSEVNSVIEYLSKMPDLSTELLDSNSDTYPSRNNCNHDLLCFAEEYGILPNHSTFADDIKKEIERIEKDLSAFTDEQIDYYSKLINSFSNKIFYGYNKNGTPINILDTEYTCASNISESDRYKHYQDSFLEQVKVPITIDQLMNKYGYYLNKHFENAFIDNNFEEIFPLSGYNSLTNNVLKKIDPKLDSDKRLIFCQNADSIILKLPFFKMCSLFELILKLYVYTDNFNYRQKFDFNPFSSAVKEIADTIVNTGNNFHLSIRFLGTCFPTIIPQICRGYTEYILPENINFCYLTQNSTGTISASNWYKLAYHYSRKEEVCILYAGDNAKNKYHLFSNFFLAEGRINPFSEIYKHLISVSKNFQKCYYISRIFKEKHPELLEYHIELPERYEFMPPSPDDYLYQSLFHYYIFTNSGKKRAFLNKNMISKFDNCPIVKSKDICTKGIYWELHSIKFNHSTFGKIIPLPSQYQNYSIFDYQIENPLD